MPSLAAPLPAANSAPVVEAIPKARRAPLSIEARDAAAQAGEIIDTDPLIFGWRYVFLPWSQR